LIVVAATVNPPLTYQWFFNSAPLPGATNSFYTIAKVQDEHNGAYFVKLTDEAGTVQSSSAELKVLSEPKMIEPVPPLYLTAVVGETVTLTATTRGTKPMLYRWAHRSPSGVTTVVTNQLLDSHIGFLSLANVNPSHTGAYILILTNEAHSLPDLQFTNAVLTVLADSDRDSMPDVWESAHGFNPQNPADATLDYDHDGLTNLDEYRAGTDPADPLSYLKVERIFATGNVNLQFVAISNRTYTVEYKNGLDDPIWVRLADIAARGSNRLETVSDPSPGMLRFYRLLTPKSR
jgi:hypothetical protein